jgi:hypothetical protein
MMSIRELAGALVRTGARLVHVLEPTEGPWVSNNIWGDQRTQGFPQQAGQVVEVLPKNTRLYGPPAVHSVSLSRGDELIPQNAEVRARVTYGCGGIENSFDCDWMHGVQFCLVCNAVSVKAVTYQQSLAVPYYAVGAAVFLGAMVAKGTVARGAPVTYTESTANLPASPDPGFLYTVPDFAREVIVHVSGNNDPGTASGVLFSFINQGSGVTVQYDAQVCAGGRAVTIPAGSTEIRVFCTGAAKLLTLQWLLGL